MNNFLLDPSIFLNQVLDSAPPRDYNIDRENRYKPPSHINLLIEEDKKDDEKNQIDELITWLQIRVEGLGLNANRGFIKSFIESNPPNLSRDILYSSLITKLQNINAKPHYFGDTNSNSTPSYENSYDNITEDIMDAFGFCCLCKKLESNKFDIDFFMCQHKYCKDCLISSISQKPSPSFDVENLECFLPYCRAPSYPEKFREWIPELFIKSRMEPGDYQSLCGICYEDFSGEKSVLNIFDCEDIFCKVCLISMIRTNMDNMKVLNIKCPTCSNPLNSEKAKGILTAKQYSRYFSLRQNAIIAKDPNARWCSRPGCEKIISRIAHTEKAICECGRETCFLCANEWHEGKTCDQAVDQGYKKIAKEIGVQQCRECKAQVQKSDGCNHMTCWVCGFQWCWICGSEFSNTHFSPLNPLGCPGLQSGAHTKKNWNKCKLYLYRLGIFLLILLGIALLPLILVVIALGIPNYAFDPDEHCCYGINCCYQIILRLGLFLLSVIFIPLTIVTLAMTGMTYLIYGIVESCLECFERIRQRSERSERLREILVQ